MVRDYVVEINEDDIRQGERGKCRLCPGAIALTRAVGRECWVGSGVGFVSEYGGFIIAAGRPDVLRDWVSRYDAGEIVGPFSFTVTGDFGI